MPIKRIRFEDFVEKYRPIKNPFNPDAPHNGYMFDSVAEMMTSLADIRDSTGATGSVVTVLADESMLWGWHIVDRIGYFILSVPDINDDEPFVFTE